MGTGNIVVELFSVAISAGFLQVAQSKGAGLFRLEYGPHRPVFLMPGIQLQSLLNAVSRSASACLAIARCISCGRSICFTPTFDTLIPHNSVCVSMICCSFLIYLFTLRKRVIQYSGCPNTHFAMLFVRTVK